MPQALPLPLREQIVQLHQEGHSLVAVARMLPVKERSVREIWRRFRQGGAAGLHNDYARCGRCGIRFPAAISAAALAFKREHPRWGAGFIRIQLARQFPEAALPKPRTLQQWFRDAGLAPARAQRPPVERERAHQVHEVWEIDAKERMRLGDGIGTSSLMMVDELSGALVGGAVFPPVSLDAGAGGAGPRRSARGDGGVGPAEKDPRR